MSILPLTQPFSIATSMLALPGGLDIIDTQYDYAAGKDVQTVTGRRNIEAVVDKAGARKLEQIFGGSVSDGDILVITSEPLYIADIHEPDDPQQQSFFSYAGYQYRVVGIDPWKDQVGFNNYLATRHVTQDLV